MSLNPHILVVEDSDEDFETVMDAAKRVGISHPIQRASSGEDGLRLLHACMQNKNTIPALVLLDLNTPKDDGRDALRVIKQDQQLCGIPLVVLTTSTNPRDVVFCYANGTNAYHVKPVVHGDHLQVVEQILIYWLSRVVLPT
jgi:two-component system, response regulator